MTRKHAGLVAVLAGSALVSGLVAGAGTAAAEPDARPADPGYVARSPETVLHDVLAVIGTPDTGSWCAFHEDPAGDCNP